MENIVIYFFTCTVVEFAQPCNMCVLSPISLQKLKQHMGGRAFWIKVKRPFGKAFFPKHLHSNRLMFVCCLAAAYKEADMDR